MKKSALFVSLILILAFLTVVSAANETGFCGGSGKGFCEKESDCVKGGCNGEICQNQSQRDTDTMAYTCEAKECYSSFKYNMKCGCSENKCQWISKIGNKNITTECEEINGSCCKGEVCAEVIADCADGAGAVFKGCNNECIPKWECKKIKPVRIKPGDNASECAEGCECHGSVVSCETETGKIMTVTAGKSGNVIIITVNKVNATTTVQITKENNKTYAETTEGKKELKIMPDTASERAIEVLKSKNITIELKDTGKGHIVYSINSTKTVKILGLIKKKVKLETEIDAETGEATKVKKPWWAFLTSEKEE